MNKATLFLLCLISSPLAFGEIFYGLGFTRLNLDERGVRVDAFSGVIGYEYGKRNFTLSPQFRYLKHKKTDFDYNGRTTLDNAFIFSLKAQYTFNNGTYIYTSPSVGRFSYITDTGYYMSDADDEFEAGLNIGVGYEFSEYFSTELTLEEFKKSEAITAGVKFRF